MWPRGFNNHQRHGGHREHPIDPFDIATRQLLLEFDEAIERGLGRVGQMNVHGNIGSGQLIDPQLGLGRGGGQIHFVQRQQGQGNYNPAPPLPPPLAQSSSRGGNRGEQASPPPPPARSYSRSGNRARQASSPPPPPRGSSRQQGTWNTNQQTPPSQSMAWSGQRGLDSSRPPPRRRPRSNAT